MLKVGDKVICLARHLWTEYAVVAVENVFAMPDGMTFEEAAAISMNYVTAYHILFECGNLRKGQKVLVHMAAGELYVFCPYVTSTHRKNDDLLVQSSG